MLSVGLCTEELTADQVRRVADASVLGFDTTAHLPDPANVAGQDRALEAIDFALRLGHPTYNLYVSGQSGTGRSTVVCRAVSQYASSRPPALDWCYVYRFERPGEPSALAFAAGGAPVFAQEVAAFVQACRRELRRAFLGEAYRRRRDVVVHDITAQRDQTLEALQQLALAHHCVLQSTAVGLAIVPLRHVASGAASSQEADPAAADGQYAPMTPQDYEALPPQERQRVSEENATVEEAVAQALPQLRALEEEARARLQDLDEGIAGQVVTLCATDIMQRHQDAERVTEYLHQLATDIIAHADVLRTESDGVAEREHSDRQRQEASASDAQTPQSLADVIAGEETLRERPAVAALLRRYRVNVLVTHREHDTAPVVLEINPTYPNLVGRIEFGLQEGLPLTDHLMLKAGALHRASGGYLILQAHDLLSQPNAWVAVKRALRFGVVAMDGADAAGAVPASAFLRPEPIPFQAKVILIGDPETYALLQALDPEFAELFKVRADFDSSMPRTPEGERFYAQFVGTVARKAHLPPLQAGAVAALIEEGSRWVSDQDRLSTVLGDLRDLTLEAGSFAVQDAEPSVDAGHVARAIAARERRLGLVPDRLDDLLRDGTILIDRSGTVVGQVNGLTVLSNGGYAFGKPARITARTAPGLAGIVNIERETMMSGPAHTKGILVLGGYLAGRFAQDFPLSLTASICFEQVYGEIEGDSASSAELYAVLSSLADLPITQSLAVTGSVNQRGEIQAIGGVNEKIEGFFEVCRLSGLTGEQGVVIPRANVRHLMLRPPVVEAVRAGQFHIYAVATIDEGIELLTGLPAGMADPDSAFPEETVNGRVSRTLHRFAEIVGRVVLPSTRIVERALGT